MDETASTAIDTDFSMGDFVTVQDQEFEKGLIVGGKLLTVGEDAYTLRLNFVVAPLKGDHVPKDETFVIDPTALGHVEEAEQERLMFVFNQDYLPDDEDGPRTLN